MRDLRILSGCDALLTALPGSPVVGEVLALAATHAESAAGGARRLLDFYGQATHGGGV
jgi:hypothetical protein